MGFLRILESLRTPLGEKLFAAVTQLGGEAVFMAAALLIYWCVSKRLGYYIFTVGFAGTVCNQTLKLLFRVPRPWVLDPDFSIVESARAAATGYSFPSGHTQNIVGTAGAVALGVRKAWVRAVCVLLMLLVPFSRMYLGVHTPLDVGVSFVLALGLVILLWPLFKTDEAFSRCAQRLLVCMLALIAAYVVFVYAWPFPENLDLENYAAGVKNGWSLLGAMLGLGIVYRVDTAHTRFDVHAPLPGQLCKLLLGLGLTAAIKTALKAPLAVLFAGHAASNAVRYFLVVLFAGLVWPLSFPFFAGLGKKKEENR